MTEKEPTIEHNSTTAYKLDNNILKIMKVLALNELDDEAAEALTGIRSYEPEVSKRSF
jgi:hypothetical protein